MITKVRERRSCLLVVKKLRVVGRKNRGRVKVKVNKLAIKTFLSILSLV